MATSLDRARRDVENAFQDVVAWADTGEQRTFAAFEDTLWTKMLALGRALVVLFLVRQVARPRAAEYEHEGHRYVLKGTRTTQLGTRFGKVPFTRPTGRLGFWKRRAADLPVDRELGLCGGFSLAVVAFVALLSAQMAFARARDVFRRAHDWAPSSRSMLRMVDAVGDEARPFLQGLPAPENDGGQLVITVDGGGAPMISSSEHSRRRVKRAAKALNRRRQRREKRKAQPRKRRTKGKKSKNSKVAFVGVIYTLRSGPDGLEGPINKRTYATFESHEALFIWLRREADKRGYGEKPSLFVADGCRHIWRLQQLYFPEAETCLDWYHVIEKLWAAGACLFPEGSEALAAWVGQRSKELRRGRASRVLEVLADAYAAIPKTGPGNKAKRERLLNILEHLSDNQHRMRYDALRRRDLDIGSGVVEGAVRNLIRVRFDGPGMRWGRERSERLLHLRCILINGQWDEFVEHLAQRGGVRLRAKPLPATPHDAKRKEAA